MGQVGQEGGGACWGAGGSGSCREGCAQPASSQWVIAMQHCIYKNDFAAEHRFVCFLWGGRCMYGQAVLTDQLRYQPAPGLIS